MTLQGGRWIRTFNVYLNLERKDSVKLVRTPIPILAPLEVLESLMLEGSDQWRKSIGSEDEGRNICQVGHLVMFALQETDYFVSFARRAEAHHQLKVMLKDRSYCWFFVVCLSHQCRGSDSQGFASIYAILKFAHGFPSLPRQLGVGERY